MKKKISTETETPRKVNHLKVKYGNVPWNKRSIIKTYSRSRPCLLKRNVNVHDDIFRDLSNKDSSAQTSTAPKLKNGNLHNLESTWRCNSSIDSRVNDTSGHCQQRDSQPMEQFTCKGQENSTGSIEKSLIIDTIKDQEKEVSPKNSTCLEGGDKMSNALTNGPMLSPIKAVNRTNYEAVSMDFTKPCEAEGRKLETNNCLSTIGKSSPFILAALMKQKKRKARKYSPMSFIRENVREKRLTLPKEYMLARTYVFKTPSYLSKFKDSKVSCSSFSKSPKTIEIVNSQNLERTIMEQCEPLPSNSINDVNEEYFKEGKSKYPEAALKRPLLSDPNTNVQNTNQNISCKEATLVKSILPVSEHSLLESLELTNNGVKNNDTKSNMTKTNDSSHSSLGIELKPLKVVLEKTLLENSTSAEEAKKTAKISSSKVHSVVKSQSQFEQTLLEDLELPPINNEGIEATSDVTRKQDATNSNLEVSHTDADKNENQSSSESSEVLKEKALEENDNQFVGKKTPESSKSATKATTSSTRPTRKGTLRAAQEITPEDKNASFHLKERCSATIRRSLRFQKSRVPLDILITMPADEVEFDRRSKRIVKTTKDNFIFDMNRYSKDTLFS
ncbi:uncharacterized protein LOC135690937 isoform X2 [Rhopilema esculentum]|uniref:uncharacterized protein LOC135690937 isoform X2 n=1 Tax=Rhopilema esculentum TaxID=499914 RepID=UPI0031DA30B0